jgi:hypothetical protein
VTNQKIHHSIRCGGPQRQNHRAQSHFALLILDVSNKTFHIHDGLNFHLGSWSAHALWALKSVKFIPNESTKARRYLITKNNATDDFSYAKTPSPSTRGKWTVLKGRGNIVQVDGHNCGPIACINGWDKNAFSPSEKPLKEYRTFRKQVCDEYLSLLKNYTSILLVRPNPVYYDLATLSPQDDNSNDCDKDEFTDALCLICCGKGSDTNPMQPTTCCQSLFHISCLMEYKLAATVEYHICGKVIISQQTPDQVTNRKLSYDSVSPAKPKTLDKLLGLGSSDEDENMGDVKQDSDDTDALDASYESIKAAHAHRKRQQLFNQAQSRKRQQTQGRKLLQQHHLSLEPIMPGMLVSIRVDKRDQAGSGQGILLSVVFNVRQSTKAVQVVMEHGVLCHKKVPRWFPPSEYAIRITVPFNQLTSVHARVKDGGTFNYVDM